MKQETMGKEINLLLVADASHYIVLCCMLPSHALVEG